MPVPEPRLLLLCEAAHRVADHCGVSIEQARAALERAFREHSLVPFDPYFNAIHDWDHAVIDWQNSSIARSGIYTIEGVRVFGQHVDDWMSQADAASDGHSITSALKVPLEASISSPRPFEARWWPLAKVVDWIRARPETAKVSQIRSGIEVRCASGRIAARGRRRIYGTDRALFIDRSDPAFVQFSDAYGELQPWFEPISAKEWRDLTFFARPILTAGEQYHIAVAAALEGVGSCTELRSKSKHRLAWADVEFLADDVMREWPPVEPEASPAGSKAPATVSAPPAASGMQSPKGNKHLPDNGEPRPDSSAALVTSASANVMPPDEAEGYTLLWDAAAEMSGANGQPLGRNWLRLIDAFWRGDLAPDGLTYFYAAPPAGREFVLLSREALAGMLLGHRTLDTGAASIDDLRHWRLDDYRNQPDDFADFFQRDPEGRVGLAVLTKALDRWREGSGDPISPNTISPEGRAPSNGMRPAVNPGLRAAIEKALKAQGIPGKTVPWKTFCDCVRSMCDGGPYSRGYGDKSIQRAVRAIKAERDKEDKSDTS